MDANWMLGPWIALGALLLAAGALAWSWSLKRQFQQHTEAMHHARASTRETEYFLATVLETMPLALFGKDQADDFRYWLWNAEAERVFGLRREEVLGRSDFELYPRGQAERFRAEDLEVLALGRSTELTDRTQTWPGHAPRHLHTVKTVIHSVEGRPHVVLGIAQDITDQRSLEEALRQAQKLESLGLLAGGIAHDFNTLLSAIGGNLELALHYLAPQPAASKYLMGIERILLKASQLTNQMFAYSGKGQMVVTRLQLNDLAEELPRLLQVSISGLIKLEFTLAPGLPEIQADAAQLHQIIMNLITNAADAIGKQGGAIKVATRVVHLRFPHEEVPNRGWAMAPGSYAVLEVSDTGCGMDEATQTKLFDPFFTTKPTGRGLGLAAMLGILKAHGGGLRLQSELQVGSTFTLYFPVAEPEPTGSATPA